MPKSQVTEFDTNDLYPIPENLPVPVQLVGCKQVTVEFTYKQGPKAGEKGGFLKWEWDWLVTDGQYAGTNFRGSTEPKITDATESDFLPLARPIVEALINRPLQIGEEVDTDLLVGLPAVATVRHQDPTPRKKGDGNWYNVELNELFPATGAYAPPGGAEAVQQQYQQQQAQYGGGAPQQGWDQQQAWGQPQGQAPDWSGQQQIPY